MIRNSFDSTLPLHSAGKAAPAKTWRALYVASRTEKKVLLRLREAGIEAYVPFVKSMRQWSDRKKLVDLPLLNGYVFVHITTAERERTLQTRGVVGFVKAEGREAEVRPEEIARLRQLVELGYQLDTSQLERHIHKGEKVKINSGPLKGMEGIVSEDKDQQQLLVLLESINCCIRVRIPGGILSLL